MNGEIASILDASKAHGWVLEPDAKRLFGIAGFDVPRSAVARDIADALAAAREIGWPVVAKVVSPAIVHKSDVRGVVTGISGDARLEEEAARLLSIPGCEAVLVEEMVSGLELILGGTIDEQFGPMVLFGMGGVGVEIYRDTSIRMAPVERRDVDEMISELRAKRLLEGYRGSAPIDREKLADMVVRFSRLLVEMQDRIESIDLNPVICTAERCVVADARIILAAGGAPKIH
ncbi:MAG: acetate--CoA ligase family protein [Candidatus Krumholzibacteria bacterium]|nr:acetate--CoA ligase family protein [Candidatus Krumholzibacteria bacterium]